MKNIKISGKNGSRMAILKLHEYPHKTHHTSKSPNWNRNGYSMCNTLGDIFEKHPNFGEKKWPLDGHLESQNFANIPIKLIIPQNPLFGTGMDTLCTILCVICVKNIKNSRKNGRRMAILNLRTS